MEWHSKHLERKNCFYLVRQYECLFCSYVTLNDLAVQFIFRLFSGGVIFYFHWEAMLISYLALKLPSYPFTNLQELYDSDFQLYAGPGSSHWSSFKHGDDLWQKIYRDKLEPNTEWYEKYQASTDDNIKWLLLDSDHALYGNYFQFK